MAESKTTTDQQRDQQGRHRSRSERDQQSMSLREAFPSPPGSSFTASPFQLLRRMSEEMDRMFERVFEGFPGERGLLTSSAGAGAWSPRIEVFQRQDQFVVRAELPGVRKEDVQVELADDQLTIQGQRRDEHEERREGFYRSERSYGSFYRAIPLPAGVIAESADASFRDGVLEITVKAPPAEVSRGRRLEIKDVRDEK